MFSTSRARAGAVDKSVPRNMHGRLQFIKRYVFALLAITSLVIGCLIPAFYDWSGSNQRYSPVIVGRTAIGLLVTVIAICMALPWLPLDDDQLESSNRRRLRFNIRTILIITTAIAAAMALLRTPFLPLLGAASYLCALAFAVHFWLMRPQFHGSFLSMLACMYLPFAWIVTASTFWRQGFSALHFASALPTVIPTFFVGQLLQEKSDDLIWLSTILTNAELVCGLWIIGQGKRLAIAYHLLVLLLSTITSFAVNALFRM